MEKPLIDSVLDSEELTVRTVRSSVSKDMIEPFTHEVNAASTADAVQGILPGNHRLQVLFVHLHQVLANILIVVSTGETR